MLIDFFKDFKLTESDIVIEKVNNRLTGIGLVFLNTDYEVSQAIKDLDRKHLGSRYIEVRRASLDWFH